MLSLVRWSPNLVWRSPLFDGFFGPEESEEEDGWFCPALDVSQDGQGYKLKAELPGMPKENIKVVIDDGVLMISGERTEEKQGESVVLSERWMGKFSRSVRLPETADTSKVEVAYENGVLTVTVPKKDEAKAQKRELAIK